MPLVVQPILNCDAASNWVLKWIYMNLCCRKVSFEATDFLAQRTATICCIQHCTTTWLEPSCLCRHRCSYHPPPLPHLRGQRPALSCRPRCLLRPGFKSRAGRWRVETSLFLHGPHCTASKRPLSGSTTTLEDLTINGLLYVAIWSLPF